MPGGRVVAVGGAIAAFLLQVLLAPHVHVFFAFPNFMAAFCLAFAVARPHTAGPVLPFVVGLLFDLVSGGPVGAMAFSLTVACTVEASVFRRSGNDTAFMAVAVLAGGVLLTEFVYGILFLLFGYALSFADALVYRILPCFAYDFVIAFILYLVFARLLGQDGAGTGMGTAARSEIKQL